MANVASAMELASISVQQPATESVSRPTPESVLESASSESAPDSWSTPCDQACLEVFAEMEQSQYEE
jgi:hypothetical protein